jgi:hypothetical protein
MWNMKNKLGLYLVLGFTFSYIITSFFLMNSVIMQTFFNLFIIGFIFYILHQYRPEENEYKFLKLVLVIIWIGRAGMYIVNVFLYKDVHEWLNNFNNYIVAIPVYIASLLIAVIFSFTWKELKR